MAAGAAVAAAVTAVVAASGVPAAAAATGAVLPSVGAVLLKGVAATASTGALSHYESSTGNRKDGIWLHLLAPKRQSTAVKANRAR